MISVCRWLRPFLAVAVASVVSACSQVQFVHQVSQHNDALELSGNQIILLNAIRASKGYPYYFTYLGDMQGKDALTAEVPSTLAFGNHQVLRHTASPKVLMNNGFNSFNVSNANSDDFALSLVTPLSAAQASVLINSDWPTEHLSMLIIRRMGISKQDLAALIENQKVRCANHSSGYAVLCGLVEEAISRCGLPRAEKVLEGMRRGLGEVSTFNNEPEDACAFEQFQMAVRLFVLASPTITPREVATGGDKGAESGGGKGGKQKQQSGKQQAIADGGGANGKQQQGVQNQVVNVNVSTREQEEKSRTKLHLRVELQRRDGTVHIAYVAIEGTRSDPGASYFMLRSPGDMIDFLGRLIKVQLRSDDARIAKVVENRKQLVPIFDIKQGLSLDRAAVSVSHEGTRYSVPRNTYEANERHMTMQSLMLVNQLLAMKVKRDNLKNATTLFIGQ